MTVDKQYFIFVSECNIRVARAAKIPFTRVIVVKGKYVKYSHFDGNIEHYGKKVTS